jgi:hypothetical protein
MSSKERRNLTILIALIVINIIGYWAAERYFNRYSEIPLTEQLKEFNFFNSFVKIWSVRNSSTDFN